MEELIVIAVCLGLNALLAAYEMAFVTVPKGALRNLAKNGNKDAQRLLGLREHPERTLSIIQIGITLVGVLSSAVGGAGAAETIEPYFRNQWQISETVAEAISIMIVVLPLTYLNVVVGELTPKSIALKNPLRVTLLGARPLFMADRLLAPVVRILEWSTKQMLRVFRSKNVAPSPETSIEIEGLSTHHREAILNLAHIESRRVRDVLVPWENVNHVKTSDSVETVVPVIFASGHTRLPVTDENGSVIGVLHTKECLALREAGNKEWRTVVHPILSVHPQDAVLAVFRQMQQRKSHMAVVVVNALPIGIVTLEDISEEIWGELYDEDDESRIRKVFADRVKAKIPPLT